MKKNILIIRSSDVDKLESLKDFINEEYANEIESKDLIVSDNLEKEYWLEQLPYSYPSEFENKDFKETRELSEKEYDIFISGEGYHYDFPSFEEWCGYVPTFNRKENNL